MRSVYFFCAVLRKYSAFLLCNIKMDMNCFLCEAGTEYLRII